MLSLPALALALLAGHGAAPAAAQQEPPAPATALPAGGDPVVATVNGAAIRKSELEAAQQRLPDQYRQVPLPMIYDPLLEQVISGRLLADEARKRQLQDRPEVQAEIARARDDVLRDSLIEQAVQSGATDERVKAAYEAAKSQPGFAAEETHAQHILVASEAEARDVLAQLEKGADFGELAKGKSTDPSAKGNGGDLGYFARDAMVPEFADAAFTLPPGTVGKDPVQSQFGWHVIKVLDRRTAVPTFEEKEPELRQQVAREVVNGLVAEVQGGAKVERFNLDGSPKLAADPAAAPGAPPAAAPAPQQPQ